MQLNTFFLFIIIALMPGHAAAANPEKNKPGEEIISLSELTPECNLVIEIKNAFDADTTHHIRLYFLINNQKFDIPKSDISFKKDFICYFRIKPGLYKISVVCQFKNLWDKQEAVIDLPDDRIELAQDRVTKLFVKLDKKPNGHLKRSRNTFSIINAPASRDNKEPAIDKNNDITLQINTLPVHAHIIVDESEKGQAPLAVNVSRSRDHVVQIYNNGFQGKMRIIKKEEIQNGKIIIIAEELTPTESKK